MSKVIPGIRGRPLRKIVKREFGSRTVTETLICGHENVVVTGGYSLSATMRRCYHPACRKAQT